MNSGVPIKGKNIFVALDYSKLKNAKRRRDTFKKLSEDRDWKLAINARKKKAQELADEDIL